MRTSRGMFTVTTAAAVALALAGCGSKSPTKAVSAPPSASATATPTATPSPSPTPTPSPTPSPTPASLADYIAALRQQFNLPAGYPQVVDRATIDDRFASNLTTDQVVNPWPGVYMDLAPGASLSDVIGHSGTIGYCASITAFKAARGNDSGYGCF